MKKFLLGVLSCLSLATISLAQAVTPEHGDTSIAAITGSDIKVKNNIINKSSAQVSYDWKMVDDNFSSAPGWSFGGMCDNNLCYYNIDPSLKTSAPVDAGDTMYHYVDFKDDGTAANGSYAWVRSSIYETGTSPIGAKSLTFIATKGTNSTITVTRSMDDIVIFPNPAKSSVNVIYDADMGVRNIGIYNLIGKAVSVYKVGSTSAKLDVEELPSGIYFIRLFNSQGKVVGTRKFTHQ